MSRAFDIVVAGAGPAGLAASALAAMQGAKVMCLTGPEKGQDKRTMALMLPSIRLLTALGVWPGDLQQHSAALRRLRMVDHTGGMISAPELDFSASEMGEYAFGWNIPLKHLIPALYERALALGVEFARVSATGLEHHEHGVDVICDDGERVFAKAVFAADGRHSQMRQAASIRVRQWAYEQDAIVTNFSHSAEHEDMSTEYHTDAGVFTTVPLPGKRSSLVWLERPERAEQLAGLSPQALAREIQRASRGCLGLISETTPVGRFPMRGLEAGLFARDRVYLIGEAAHVLPPIGAQGLNMSLRDAALAAELATEALGWGEDPGANELMKRYDERRRADVAPRQRIIDLMNRSLLSDFKPFQMARAIGIGIAGHVPFIRSRVMAEGLAQARDLPKLMQQQMAS